MRDNNYVFPFDWKCVDNAGLTKREYFAAMAMQAYVAGGFNSTFTNEELAVLSAKKADALLAELERTK